MKSTYLFLHMIKADVEGWGGFESLGFVDVAVVLVGGELGLRGTALFVDSSPVWLFFFFAILNDTVMIRAYYSNVEKFSNVCDSSLS